MVFIEVRVIKDVFTTEQKREIISRLTDARRCGPGAGGAGARAARPHPRAGHRW